jgi:hypothetical protein
MAAPTPPDREAARRWRERTRPTFDRMEVEGCFAPAAARIRTARPAGEGVTPARLWHLRHRARFDAMERAGCFAVEAR